MTRKSWFRMAAAAGMAAGLATATLPVANAASASTFTLGDYILPAQMTNINPFLRTGNWSPLFQYVFSSLYYFNLKTGRVVPQLASGFGTWSANRLTYTVHLNPRAKWSNGAPVTASDVIYSYDVMKNPALDPYDLWAHLQSVTGSGDTVEFHLKASFPDLASYLTTVYIVPKAQWSKAGNPAQNLNLHPIGSGPFELYAYHQGSNIVLKPNPYSFMGHPHFQYLNIVMYANAETVTLALEKGIIKTTEGTIAMPSLPTLLRTPTNRLQKFPGLDNFAVFMNTKVPALQNVWVRRAIQSAVDQEALITKGEEGGTFRANPGWMPPVFHHYVDQAVFHNPAYGFSLKRARADLKRAGYRPGAGGIMEKGGKPLTLTYYEASGAPAQDKEASMIQGWLKDVGIDVTPRLVTWPELASLASTGSYQLLQDGFAMPPDPVAAMASMFSGSATAPIGKATPGLNYTRFNNPRLNRLLAQAAVTTSISQRTRLLDQAQVIVANQAPVALMYNDGNHMVYRTGHWTGWPTNYPVNSAYAMLAIRPK